VNGDRRSGWRRDLAAALPGWLVARILTLGVFGAAAGAFERLRPATHRYARGLRLQQGLLTWDGDWYTRIARDGYAALPVDGRRYFPLYPLISRWFAFLPGISIELALVLIANVSALAAAVLLHRLAREELRDDRLAGRAAWLLALTPASFVLVLGYTEGLAIALAVGTFLALRYRRWGWAAAMGALGGLLRPTGVLIAVPVAWEAVKVWRQGGVRERLWCLPAMAAPLAGAAAYLLWVGVRFGDPLQPLSVQQSSRFRGSMINPLVVFWRGLTDLWSSYYGGNALRVPFAIVVVVLTVVCVRRLPGSYGAYTVASVAIMLSTERWSSLERYALGIFPLVLALAWVTASPRVERAVLVVSAGGMSVYTFLSFLGPAFP
jgi:hypothetical protein